MARPSRGFTVAHSSQPPAPTCPSAATLSLTIADPSTWDLEPTWSPDVLVGTLGLYGQLNGGPSFLIDTGMNVHSGYTFEINPNDYGSSGDTFSLLVQATDVGGCPDFFSNLVASIIE